MQRLFRAVKRTLAAKIEMTWFQRLAKLFGCSEGVPLEASRSPKWETVRNDFIKRNRECVACGAGNALEVHHVLPFHLRRDLELVESNLVALCRDCHFYFGHLKDWSSWNEHVRTDAAAFRAKVRARP